MTNTPASPRSKRVRRAVRTALLEWRLRQNGREEEEILISKTKPLNEVLQPIERRKTIIDESLRNENIFPSFPKKTVSPSRLFSFWRLISWFRLLMNITFKNLVDRLLRRNSEARSAVHLREGIEKAGGTFVKIGQQAAMRIDLLPWAYCVELSKMLDKMVPFSVEQALEAVERSTNKPWQETFAVFDPEPIGSASVACVYQAMLKNGTKVAVKVRRPDVIRTFKADFQILDWGSRLLEFLTIFRPGFTKHFRLELRETLLEELDFRLESRFQDTFRRSVKSSGKDFFTGPKVYFHLSNDEVLVQEHVSGLWLWEVISAVEHRRASDLALLREMNIDPILVSKRILWVAFWSMDENLFFHADPHPANILIRENSEITLVDFGSCGSFNNHQRVALEQLVLSTEKQDVEGMSLAAVALMEPVPPVDLPAMLKISQEENIRVLQTFNTEPEFTEYWERTSARQWYSLIRLANIYKVPLNPHMLRMIRATLLYDSIVLRLDNKLNRYEEYANFMKDRANLIKKKWRRRLRENAGDRMLLRIEELGNSVGDLMLRAQSTFSRPVVKLGSTIDKLVYTASVLTRLIGRVGLITVLAVLGVSLYKFFTAGSLDFLSATAVVLRHPVYLALLIIAGILNIRLIAFRLSDKDK